MYTREYAEYTFECVEFMVECTLEYAEYSLECVEFTVECTLESMQSIRLNV